MIREFLKILADAHAAHFRVWVEPVSDGLELRLRSVVSDHCSRFLFRPDTPDDEAIEEARMLLESAIDFRETHRDQGNPKGGDKQANQSG